MCAYLDFISGKTILVMLSSSVNTDQSLQFSLGEVLVSMDTEEIIETFSDWFTDWVADFHQSSDDWSHPSSDFDLISTSANSLEMSQNIASELILEPKLASLSKFKFRKFISLF